MSNNDGVFLYVGIVAIWAGFLIPAWIRRPHAHDAGDVAGDVAGDAAEVAEVADADPGAGYFAEDADLAEEMAGQLAYVTVAASAYEGQAAARATASEYCEQMPDYVPSGRPDRPPTGDRWPAASRPPVAASAPSQSRQQMLRARRRMLAILVALSLVTCGFFVLGLVSWWICVPPVAMLVLYVLLLREIAMADAELATKRAARESRDARARDARARAASEQLARDEQARDGQLAAQLAGQRREAERAAPAIERDAEIIDISGRIGDQLYDQYADAAVRAVGD